VRNGKVVGVDGREQPAIAAVPELEHPVDPAGGDDACIGAEGAGGAAEGMRMQPQEADIRCYNPTL
jgi:hypothetical protein